MVRTCPILALAMSYHNLSPSRQKKKRCLGWSWWSSWHCTGTLRPVKHCFFFLNLNLTVAVLWPSTAMILCCNSRHHQESSVIVYCTHWRHWFNQKTTTIMYVCHDIHTTAISCWWREQENSSSHFREKLPHVVIGSYFMPGSVLMHHHCYLWGQGKK